MVRIHLESGKILPKAGRLAYVFQQQRMAEVHAWTEVQSFPLQWLIIIRDCFRSIHQVAPQGGFKIHSSCLTDNTGGITVKAVPHKFSHLQMITEISRMSNLNRGKL